MKTDLIQSKPVTTYRKELVEGKHVTKVCRARINVKRATGTAVRVSFGYDMTADSSQIVRSDDLRELSDLFREMANVLDSEQAARDEEAPF